MFSARSIVIGLSVALAASGFGWNLSHWQWWAFTIGMNIALNAPEKAK